MAGRRAFISASAPFAGVSVGSVELGRHGPKLAFLRVDGGKMMNRESGDMCRGALVVHPRLAFWPLGISAPAASKDGSHSVHVQQCAIHSFSRGSLSRRHDQQFKDSLRAAPSCVELLRARSQPPHPRLQRSHPHRRRRGHPPRETGRFARWNTHKTAIIQVHAQPPWDNRSLKHHRQAAAPGRAVLQGHHISHS